MPIWPLAPARFSTTTCWPMRSAIFGPMRRDRMSAASPGGEGTSTLTGLEGEDCARPSWSGAARTNPDTVGTRAWSTGPLLAFLLVYGLAGLFRARALQLQG